MATQRPISTISYNSEAFLKEKLEQWLKAHLISAYLYICHKGEDGDKDHIHLRIEPNKKLDSMNLSEELKEYRFDEKKPRGVRPWRFSKEEDWILYAVHDKTYLNAKYGGGEQGEKLPYDKTDLKSSEDFDIETAFIRAKAYLKHTASGTLARLKEGENPINLIGEGINPFQVNALTRALTDTRAYHYREMVHEMHAWKHRYEVLSNALERMGFEVEIDSYGVVDIKRKGTESAIEPKKKRSVADIIEEKNK